MALLPTARRSSVMFTALFLFLWKGKTSLFFPSLVSLYLWLLDVPQTRMKLNDTMLMLLPSLTHKTITKYNSVCIKRVQHIAWHLLDVTHMWTEDPKVTVFSLWDRGVHVELSSSEPQILIIVSIITAVISAFKKKRFLWCQWLKSFIFIF